MTDQQYTPTTEQIELLVLGQLKQSAEKRGIPVDVEADRADFRHWLAERDARIEAAARIEGLRLAQQIISGDLPVNESRDRHDMVNAGYLIRELDEEIRDQTLGEQDDD